MEDAAKIADTLVRLRQEAGLSQDQLAKAVGSTQGTISRAERGAFSVNSPSSRKVVELLQQLGPEGIKQKYLEATGQVPKTETTDTPKKPVKVKRGKAHAAALTPAITLELRAFCRKHGLSITDAAAELSQTTQFIGFVFNNQIKLSPPQVAVLRQKMADYKPTAPGQFKPTFDHSVPGNPALRKSMSDPKSVIDIMGSIDQLGLSNRAAHRLQLVGINIIHQLIHAREVGLLRIKHFGFKSLKEVKSALAEYGLKLETVAPKPEPVKEAPKAPAAPTPPPIKLSEPAAPVPVDAPPEPVKEPSLKLKLVVLEGHRLNNGDNIAPVLKIDGKTMHVFTHVPGGVFVSYVEAQMQME